MQVNKHNYPNTKHKGDVTDVKGVDLPKIDLLIGGSSCKDLSCLKNGKGLQGEKSKLLFEYGRLLKECLIVS